MIRVNYNLVACCALLMFYPVITFGAINPNPQLNKLIDYNVSMCGVSKITSNIVLNACNSIGADIQHIITQARKSCLGGDDIVARGCSIISGYRSPNYNSKIGGASKSQHVSRKAMDVKVSTRNAAKFAQLLKNGLCVYNQCNGGLGYYNGGNFHIDIRSSKTAWGPNKSSSSIKSISDRGVRRILTLHRTNADGLKAVARINQVRKTGRQQPYKTPQARAYRQVYTAPQRRVADYTQAHNPVRYGAPTYNPYRYYTPAVSNASGGYYSPSQPTYSAPERYYAPDQDYEQTQSAFVAASQPQDADTEPWYAALYRTSLKELLKDPKQVTVIRLKEEDLKDAKATSTNKTLYESIWRRGPAERIDAI